MARREQFSVGELTLSGVPKYKGAQNIKALLFDASGDILLATGLVPPTDSNPGFAKGCTFIDTNVAAGTSGLYQNVGTNLLCNFDRLDSTLAAGSMALATGSILVGAAGVGSAKDAKTSGQILVGDGTTLQSVALGTDATLAASGALTIANNAITTAKILDAAVTAAKLANGAGVAALLTSGLGGSVNILKATVGAANTVVAANATKDRACLVVAVVTEAFATNTGTRTLISVGEDNTVDKLWDNTDFPNAMAIGTIIVGAFTNLATKKIILTNVPAVGDGTGGVAVTVIAIPTT